MRGGVDEKDLAESVATGAANFHFLTSLMGTQAYLQSVAIFLEEHGIKQLCPPGSTFDAGASCLGVIDQAPGFKELWEFFKGLMGKNAFDNMIDSRKFPTLVALKQSVFMGIDGGWFSEIIGLLSRSHPITEADIDFLRSYFCRSLN